MPRILFQLLSVCSLFLVVGLAGCGDSIDTVPVEPAAPPPVKAMLNDVAASGELGSSAQSIREGLTALKATDSAKADELLKDLDDLETTSDPSQIKTKAKAMADKL